MPRNPKHFTKVRVEDPTWPALREPYLGRHFSDDLQKRQQEQQSKRRKSLEKLQSMGFPDLEIRQGLHEPVCFAVKSCAQII